ncbi:MAG: response regulator [Nitrososphaeraceae archaeon]
MINERNVEHRVMIIDDNTDILLTYKQILEDSGFRVDAFEDPMMAMAAFKAGKENGYELLLIDIYFEKHDINVFSGFNVYEEMRKSGKKMPPVCFVTAFPNYYDMLKQSFPMISVKCFLKKPIEARDLVAKVRQEITGLV